MAKKQDLEVQEAKAELATTATGGALAPRAGTGAMVEGRDASKAISHLVMYQGTPTEEREYGDSFKRGEFIDALERRSLGTKVSIIPVAGWMTWSKFVDGQVAPAYSFTSRAQVPAADLQWVEKDGKRTPPAAVECVNMICLVNDETYPVLFRFKRTGLKAYQRVIEPMEARRGHGVYELASEDDKNSKGQAFKRLTARYSRQATVEELALVENIKGVLSEVRAKAAQVEDTNDGGTDAPPF